MAPAELADVSLSVFRAKGYLFGAAAGGLTAVALVAGRSGRRKTALFLLAWATVCGTLSVANEEAAQRLDRPADQPQ